MTVRSTILEHSAFAILVFVILNLYDHTQLMSNMPPKPKLNVHSFPRPPLLEKTPRHLQVKWGGQTIADTKDAFWVLETTHPPSYVTPLATTPIPVSQEPTC